MVSEAGFDDFVIVWRGDVFAGAPQQSSAAQFETIGINFQARKGQARRGRATLGAVHDTPRQGS